MRHPRLLIACLAALLMAGCDPILNISGAFFPAWMFCMFVGVLMAWGVRTVIQRTGLEPHIGPRVLIYGALYAACTLFLWLAVFRQ